MDEANLKAPLLKLFEFLMASMCLFLVDDNEPVPHRFDRVYKESAPAAAASKTWWTVDVKTPPPVKKHNPQADRAYNTLCKVRPTWSITKQSVDKSNNRG